MFERPVNQATVQQFPLVDPSSLYNLEAGDTPEPSGLASSVPPLSLYACLLGGISVPTLPHPTLPLTLQFSSLCPRHIFRISGGFPVPFGSAAGLGDGRVGPGRPGSPLPTPSPQPSGPRCPLLRFASGFLAGPRGSLQARVRAGPWPARPPSAALLSSSPGSPRAPRFSAEPAPCRTPSSRAASSGP